MFSLTTCVQSYHIGLSCPPGYTSVFTAQETVVMVFTHEQYIVNVLFIGYCRILLVYWPYNYTLVPAAALVQI